MLQENLKEVQPHGTVSYNFAVYTRTLERPFKISVHWHDEYEILHVLEGKITLLVQGEKYTVSKHEAIFIHAKEVHAQMLEDEEENRVKYVCYVFGEQFLFPSRDSYIYNSIVSKVLKDDCSTTQILDCKSQVGRDIIQSLNQLLFLYEDKSNALKIQIVLLTIFDLILENHLYKKDESKRIEHNAVIIKALEVMNKQALEEYSIQNIADGLHINVDYFIKLFKKHVGITPNKYLLEVRLDKAKQLLQFEHHKNISQVAEECGFSDLNYFCRMFKKYHHVTATEVRGEFYES